jgi:hypothetical protein
MMSAEENKAVARRELEEIWTKGNLAAAEEIYAPNYIRGCADRRVANVSMGDEEPT